MLNLDQLGFYLFMDEQEKKQKDEEEQKKSLGEREAHDKEKNQNTRGNSQNGTPWCFLFLPHQCFGLFQIIE